MTDIYNPSDDSYFLSDVLRAEIPRLLKNKKNLTFFEMGSGSGIQLQTISELGVKKSDIFSADINLDAVKKCRKLVFNCIHSNLFSKVGGKFDIIVFNPPYLLKDSVEPLESRIATTGGKKGSEIINRFLKQAKVLLKNNGKIFLLTSSLTKDINFIGYKKEIVGKLKLFFEELIIFELILDI